MKLHMSARIRIQGDLPDLPTRRHPWQQQEDSTTVNFTIGVGPIGAITPGHDIMVFHDIIASRKIS